MTKELREKLTDLAALVTAVVALGTAVKELREALQGAGTEVWKNWPWYVVPAVVFLATLLWRRERLVQWLNPRSTVSRRDAFHIGRKYLLGREADIERLLRALAEWPLVFLVGESGAGKSSLLERGILPRLKEIPGQFPLLINSWGPDWIEGPREALAQAFDAALDEPLRNLLGVKGPVTSGDALAIIARLRSKATRAPILLFDQVDDYQTRHRDKFLSDPERTLLSAEALAAANPFWREVADLLKSGGVRCLFTTRSDAKIGLESVRFQEPKVYLLDPLEKSAAADLLAEISKDAVNHPEKGFDRLKERLLTDLAADGWVLPIQMQVAFNGLAEMHFLSVGEYERQGGLPGLEALHLESRISAAARAVSESVAEVQSILLSMVDRATRKTVPQSTERLLQVFPGVNPSRLTDLLEKFELDEVVRRRIDPGGEGSVWLLDHDYLSRGLLELNRRAQRWPLLLEEAARSYEGARGLFEHWKKLLPPVVQIRLFYERLRGRFNYGKALAYAQLSTVRLLIWLLISLLFLFGWQVLNVRNEASRLFAEFGQEDMTQGELRAIWELTAKDQSVRRSFLDLIFASGANARRFNLHGEMALHAAAGFRVEDREYIIDNILRDRCIPKTSANTSLDPAMIEACALIIKHIAAPQSDVRNFTPVWLRNVNDIDSLLEVRELLVSLQPDPKLSELLVGKILEVTAENGPRPTVLPSGAFDGLLVYQDKRRLAEQFLLESRKGKMNPVFATFVIGYLTLVERWEIFSRVAQVLRESGRTEREVQARDGVASSLSREGALIVLGLILDGENDSLESTESLPTALNSQVAREVLRSILEENINGSDLSFVRWDTLDCSSLVSRLDSSDALDLWKLYKTKLTLSRIDWKSDWLLTTMESLADRLSPRDAWKASASTLAEMQQTMSVEDLSNLTGALGTLKQKVPAEVAIDALTLLRQRMNTAQKVERRILVTRLGELGPSLAPAGVDECVLLILAEMRSTEGDITETFGLSKFAASMSESLVRETVDFLGSRLESTSYPDALLEILGSFKPRLTSTEIQQILSIVLLREKKGQVSTSKAMQFFLFFGERSSPELASLMLQKWIDTKRLSSHPYCENVVSIIQSPRDPRVFDLLKWPTCSVKSRQLLISRLDDLVPAATFGFKGNDGQYHPDIWGKFLPWAKKQGFNVETPPILPNLNDLVAVKVFG